MKQINQSCRSGTGWSEGELVLKQVVTTGVSKNRVKKLE